MHGQNHIKGDLCIVHCPVRLLAFSVLCCLLFLHVWLQWFSPGRISL